MTRSRWLVGSILVVSAVGAVHSVRRDRPARFAGIRLPGTAAQHALSIGSPLSAPPVMLTVLAFAAGRERRELVRVLATLLVVGILGEVDTWATLRRPGADPVGAACVLADLVLPAALLKESRSARGARRS